MSKGTQRTGKTFIGVSAVIFISKLLGFLRDVVFASIFGTTILTDLFQLIFSFPGYLFASIGTALSSVNIPDLTYYINSRSREERDRYLSNLFAHITLWATLLCVLGIVFAPAVTRVIAPGLNDDVVGLAVLLTRIMIPTLLFVSLTYVAAGVLQVHGYFLLSSSISIPFNLLVIAALLIKGVDIVFLGYVTTIGWLLQFLIQFPVLWKEKYRFFWRIDFKNEHTILMFKQLGPILLGNSLLQLCLIIDRSFASHLEEGTIGALGFGSNLFVTVTSVFIVAMSTVIFPRLSQYCLDAADLILEKLERLKSIIAARAAQHKYTLCIGRTHGVHGEPTTFGLKMALWYSELERNLLRLRQAREVIACGAISGAVGNFAHLDPRVEEYVCEKLQLTLCLVSTQVIQRDRHAQFMATLAVIASSLEKMATEIRNLQRTDILEAEEPFQKGQKGSSAMPHKRNPMMSERVAGLSRVLRGNALAAMENVALWHERDLTHSSVERVIIPDSCILLDYMLQKFIGVMEGLVIYEDNMAQNIDKTLGLVFSQQVLLALIGKGMLREEAYSIVQQRAMQSWNEKLDYKQLLLNDDNIKEYMSDEEVEKIFNFGIYTNNVDYIFRRCGLE